MFVRYPWRRTIFSAVLVICFGWKVALALVSVTSRGSFGVYRDDRDRLHTPFYYNLGVDGIFSHGLRGEFDIILNNDFSFSEWQVVPASAHVTLPVRVFASKSDIQFRLGRQLLYRGFDISLLDGVETRWTLGSEGQSEWVIYGGWARALDLWSGASVPLVGSIWSQRFGVWSGQLGVTGRYDGLAERNVIASLGSTLDDLPLSPQWVSRWELGVAPWGMAQTWNEVELSISKRISASVAYAVRNPKRISTSPNDFIYRLLASSATKIWQSTFRWDWSDQVRWEVMGRTALFDQEQGYHLESSWSWIAGRDHQLRPVFAAIRGFGGLLWDFGVSHDWSWSDRSQLASEVAIAYLDKINHIRGWAYQIREGYRYAWSAHLHSGIWFECERNHRFDFDARTFVHVTWFH